MTTEVKYERVPESVVENGVRRMTGRHLYFDASGNAVDPYTATGVQRPETAFTPTPQVSALDQAESIPVVAVPTEAASEEAVNPEA